MGIPIQMIGNVGTLLGRNKGPSMGGNHERLFWATGIIHTRSILYKTVPIMPFYIPH